MRFGQGITGSSPPRRIVWWQALACTVVLGSSGSISFAVRHGNRRHPAAPVARRKLSALTKGMFTQKNNARMLQTKAPVVLQLVHQDRATQVAPSSGSPLLRHGGYLPQIILSHEESSSPGFFLIFFFFLYKCTLNMARS